ncbi:MAG TPA: hypothetical protein VGN90_13900 [Pyrinomonadaceae bacterium]|jgi:hypothetical protein|nr:hypothetical protein [Pyrinomonadaceae bacterium]
MEKTNTQILGRRQIVESLDREFARLHVNSGAAIARAPAGSLYLVPAQAGIPSSTAESTSMCSIGEGILRSAATVERTFGGITSNLWDDPFEWTLPEYLSTPDKITAHLAEVEEIRRRAFNSFADDDCLLKRVSLPSGESQPLIALLLETLVQAVNHQAQALLVLRILSGISPPRFII